MHKTTDKELLEALYKVNGNLMVLSRTYKVPIRTLQNWRTNDETFARHVYLARNGRELEYCPHCKRIMENDLWND